MIAVLDGVTFGAVNVVGGTYDLDCRSARVGSWSFELWYDGVPVDFTGSGFTVNPQVWVAAELTVESTQTRLDVEVPAHGGEPARPAGQAHLFALVEDPVCRAPVAGVPIAVDLEFVTGSGGHLHESGNRTPVPRPGVNEGMALRSVVPSERSTTFNATTGTLAGPTDRAGTIGATLTAGQVSGLVWVTGRSSGALPPFVLPFEPALLDLEVRLDVDLARIDPTLLEPAGARPGEHEDNQWIDPSFAGALDSMGAEYLFHYWIEQDPPQYRVLRITDASLPWGGMYDLNLQYWVVAGSGIDGHGEHRDGGEVDIGYRVMDRATGIVVGDEQVVRRRVGAVAAREGVFARPEWGTHLHLRFHAP